MRGFLTNPWTIGLTCVLVGAVLAVYVPRVLSDGTKSTPSKARDPLTGTIIVPGGVISRYAASMRASPGRAFLWQQPVAIEGYCVGEPTRPSHTKTVFDERWLILHKRQLIPAWAAHVGSLEQHLAERCPGSAGIGGPQSISVSLHKEPRQDSLEVTAPRETTIGFAYFAPQGHTWRPLALRRETGSSSAEALPVGLATASLAVACWASGVPANPKGVLVGKLITFSGMSASLKHRAELKAKQGAEVACAPEEYGSTRREVPVHQHSETPVQGNQKSATTPLRIPSETYKASLDSSHATRSTSEVHTTPTTRHKHEEVK
jgi:hypothetical protein